MLTKAEKRQLLENWGDWCRGYVYHLKNHHTNAMQYFKGGMHSLAQSLKVFDKDINDSVLCAVFREKIEEEDAEDIVRPAIFWS